MNADDPAEGSFLSRIGERVRRARAQRGMTRKLLARHSGVSERHLAELESGRGNFSVVLLRHVAVALDVPVATLVDDGPEPTPALELALAFLRRLEPEQLAQAHDLLTRHFVPGPERERFERIALIGLRGAGKSTLGRELALRRGVPFIELDREIEIASGLHLDAIFDLYGQAGFRRFERQALEHVLRTQRQFVLATSGSIVSDAQTYGLLLAACRTVWLRAAPAEHMRRVVAQGDLRPMAGNSQAMADLQAILATREAMYRRADIVLDTGDRDVATSTEELVATLATPSKQNSACS